MSTLRVNAFACVLAIGVFAGSGSAYAAETEIDENCMTPIDIILAQVAPSNGQNLPTSVSLEAIEEAYGEETRHQAEEWARTGHNFFQSLYWRCIGHRRSWTEDGHARGTSNDWVDNGHQYVWTSDGHYTGASAQWFQDQHIYLWSLDGHSPHVSHNWSDIGHPYQTTRGNQAGRPDQSNGAGSWYDFQFPQEK